MPELTRPSTPNIKETISPNPIKVAVPGPTFESLPMYLYDHFRLPINNLEDSTISELTDIYNYLKETIPHELQTPEYMKLQLAELEHRFGAPHWNQPRHRKMHEYIRLSQQIKYLNRQRDLL